MGAFRVLEDAFEKAEIGYSTRDGLSPYIRTDVDELQPERFDQRRPRDATATIVSIASALQSN
jgi:hypothetical protein